MARNMYTIHSVTYVKHHERRSTWLHSRSCVKVEVAVLGSLSLTVLMVSVDVKQH